MEEDDEEEEATPEQIAELRAASVELLGEVTQPDFVPEIYGVEVDEFVEEARAFVAACDEGRLEDFDCAGFLDRFMEFCREADGILDIQIQAEEIADEVDQGLRG